MMLNMWRFGTAVGSFIRQTTCSAAAWHRSRASRFTLEVGHVQWFKRFYPGEARKRRYLQSPLYGV